MPYNRLSDYLKKKYGTKVQKVCIDAGFTCPNRDGKVGVGGCIFCGEQGSGEQILNKSISVEEQIEKGIEHYGGQGKYIAYFQSYTNTYAPTEKIIETIMPAVENQQIVAISLATRPDCIDEQMVKAIKQAAKGKDIFIELGLQTSSDITAKLINRCYDSFKFTEAVNILNKYSIEIVVHIILGLPNETQSELEQTVKFLNKHKYSGIKIHSLYVNKDTRLAELFTSGAYTPLTLEQYVEQVVYVLTHISKDIVVHRLTGDGDKKLLLAPEWSRNKIGVLNFISKLMRKGGCVNDA